MSTRTRFDCPSGPAPSPHLDQIRAAVRLSTSIALSSWSQPPGGHVPSPVPPATTRRQHPEHVARRQTDRALVRQPLGPGLVATGEHPVLPRRPRFAAAEAPGPRHSPLGDERDGAVLQDLDVALDAFASRCRPGSTAATSQPLAPDPQWVGALAVVRSRAEPVETRDARTRRRYSNRQPVALSREQSRPETRSPDGPANCATSTAFGQRRVEDGGAASRPTLEHRRRPSRARMPPGTAQAPARPSAGKAVVQEETGAPHPP
jgi:hypothetical protein